MQTPGRPARVAQSTAVHYERHRPEQTTLYRLVQQHRHKGAQQLRLALADDAVLDAARLWEYTVLATGVDYSLEGVAQLYRDRCDCDNGFDELKNLWGLSGFTTQDITC